VAVEHLVVDDDDVREPSTVSPSPWTAVAARCGTQTAASRTQLQEVYAAQIAEARRRVERSAQRGLPAHEAAAAIVMP
jgi:hypothetical protein